MGSRRYRAHMRVGSVVFRVHDIDAQLAFWTAALDYVPREAPEADWAVLRPRVGGGPNLSLSAKPSQVQDGPRMHLDLYTDDQARDVERLLALGATRPHEPNRPADADYVILADPEGNRFCVVDAS
jgi:catechol 2,3-dioxygenase-like lactoylglutathione lyase family enzyme